MNQDISLLRDVLHPLRPHKLWRFWVGSSTKKHWSPCMIDQTHAHLTHLPPHLPPLESFRLPTKKASSPSKKQIPSPPTRYLPGVIQRQMSISNALVGVQVRSLCDHRPVRPRKPELCVEPVTHRGSLKRRFANGTRHGEVATVCCCSPGLVKHGHIDEDIVFHMVKSLRFGQIAERMMMMMMMNDNS